MVSIDDAIIARLKTHGEKFEVLVDPFKARKIKQGDCETDFMASPHIYKDVSSADEAQAGVLQKVFGTENVEEIAVIILRKGEIHLTSEQRKEMLEEKKKSIVSYIARNAVDPKTGYPHPIIRIENAIEKANIHVDIFKSTEKQIDDTVKKIRPLIPLRFEMRKIAVKVPSAYAGKMHGILATFGQVLKEEWANDGTLFVLVEITAGLQNEFFDKINAVTKGDAEIKIMDKS
ncbi:MAG: ribosome assembly factor SBDS [Candidatus Methanofastidiosia archaeon]